jgi:hypothetical protein
MGGIEKRNHQELSAIASNPQLWKIYNVVPSDPMS